MRQLNYLLLFLLFAEILRKYFANPSPGEGDGVWGRGGLGEGGGLPCSFLLKLESVPILGFLFIYGLNFSFKMLL